MPSLLRTTRLLTRLALGGLFVGAATLAPEVAWAQAAPVFDGGGLVELVSPTGLVGDGATAADLWIVALSPEGTPLTGLKGKPQVSSGTASELVDAGGGLYRFTYTPPRTESVTTVTVTWKGKIGAAKEATTRSWSFPVAPPRSQKITVATNPPQLVLGQDASASVAVNLAGGERQNLTGVQLSVRPSAGTVENLIGLGGGQFTALYTAPAVRYPHVALLTAVDRRDPSKAYSAIAVPLVGKADYPVTVAPNARVILKVAGRDFGPIPADAQGRATVPIIVPPGTKTATAVQIAADGKVTESVIDLQIPETKRIALFPTATAIPSDGRLQIPVRAFVVTPDGKPDDSAQVVFTATAGVVSPAKHEGGGVYVATYTPPFGNAATQATLAVNLADKPSVQADSLPVNLVPARATKVTLATEPAVLPNGADGFKVFAKVSGPDGSGLGGRTVSFLANGARLKDGVKDLRNGDYQANFTTTGNSAVELAASVAATPTGNPLARVLVLPNSERVTPDGASTALLTVATVDEFGHPVPNQEVSLRLTTGDGQLPATTTTNADGIAQVFYTAGRKNGAVTVAATVGDLSAAATLIQAPGTVMVPDLPVSGAKDVASVAGEWQGSLAGVRIAREGAAVAAIPVVAPTPTASVGVGTVPAKVALTSEPATVSAGGTVVVKVRVEDASGRGVGGQQLDFLTSAGSLTGVTDLGGGAYQAMLTVPAGTTGEIKISASTRDGSAAAMMRIPVGGADAAWGASPFSPTTQPTPFTQPTTAPTPTPAQPTAGTAPVMSTTPATTGASTTTTTVTKVAPAGDRPWLRLRAGYGFTSYGYTQSEGARESVLYPSDIEIGAGANGLEIAAKAWIPSLPYLGADVKLRAGAYQVEPAPLCQKLGSACEGADPVTDWLLELDVLAAGRYPFEVGNTQFSLGGRVGLSRTDIQVYKVIENEISLEQFPLWGLALGPEVGVDVGENLFFHTYFLQHLEGGSNPYYTQFGVDGGYAFGKGGGLAPFLSAAYDFGVREMEINNSSGKPVGALSDSQHMITLSAGIQL